MNCTDIQENISLYIDDLLDARDKQLVEEHLSECKNCAQEYEMLQANIEALKSIPQVELPEGFKDKLHSKLVAEQKKSKMKSWRSYSVIAAAVLIMVVSALQNQFYDKAGTESAQEEAGSGGMKSKWMLANDMRDQSADNIEMSKDESEDAAAPEMAADMPKAAMFAEDVVLKDFEGHVTIKDESTEEAVDYIREYVIVSSWFTEIEVDEIDDEGKVKIQLQVSSGGFDLLLDHITAYPNVTDFNVSVMNMNERNNVTATADDTVNETTKEMALSSEHERDLGVQSESQFEPDEHQNVQSKLYGGQEGTSTIIVEITSK